MAQVKKTSTPFVYVVSLWEGRGGGGDQVSIREQGGEGGVSHRLTFPLVSPKAIFRPHPIGQKIAVFQHCPENIWKNSRNVKKAHFCSKCKFLEVPPLYSLPVP